jgi:hypothetical protein
MIDSKTQRRVTEAMQLLAQGNPVKARQLAHELKQQCLQLRDIVWTLEDAVHEHAHGSPAR